MAIPFEPLLPGNKNNPSKELLGASGIYGGQFSGSTNQLIIGDPQTGQGFYSADQPNTQSHIPNTGQYPFQVTTTPNPNPRHAFLDSALSSGNRFIDDMLVFNNYVHYVGPPIKTFDPQSFMQQSVVSFNMYNLGNRS